MQSFDERCFLNQQKYIGEEGDFAYTHREGIKSKCKYKSSPDIIMMVVLSFILSFMTSCMIHLSSLFYS